MFTFVVIAGFVVFVVVVLQTILHLRHVIQRNRRSESGVCMRCGKPLDNAEPSFVCHQCGEPIVR